jgi:menaquinone-dependent protoporphyrinogen IX oxidase
MGDVVVIYKSKYGTTEKYAKWIAEDTGADLFKAGQINADKLKDYNIIVYCGGLYAGGMLGFSFIKKNYELIKDKNLIVAAVGATLKKEDAAGEVKAQNLTPEMMNHVQFFLLRGGLNYKKMNVLDRFLMYLLVKSIKKKNPEEMDNDSKGVLATYGKTMDFTNRKSIADIVDTIKNAQRQ